MSVWGNFVLLFCAHLLNEVAELEHRQARPIIFAYELFPSDLGPSERGCESKLRLSRDCRNRGYHRMAPTALREEQSKRPVITSLRPWNARFSE